MSCLILVILRIVIVVLAGYGLVKVFHKVRTKWRNRRARLDREAAESRASAGAIAALPGRLVELSRLHNDLKVQVKQVSQRLEELEEGGRIRQRKQAELNRELAVIRKALNGYI